MPLLLLLLAAEEAAWASSHPASAPGSRAAGELSLGALAGVVVGTAGVVAVAFLAVCALQRRRKAGSGARHLEENILDALSGLPRRFTERELQTAARELRERGDPGSPPSPSSLRRGRLPDGTEIAVRSAGAELSTAQLTTAGRVRHPNVVALRGFCARGPRAILLVHEVAPNGPLDGWLFHEPGAEAPPRLLDWPRRFGVAVGAARGLAFLHDEWAGGVVRAEVRPGNVMLGGDFAAKWAVDFGSESDNVTDAGESPPKGTPRRPPRLDYAPPERGSPSEKRDAYSYGLVLFELLSGRRNECPVQTDGESGDGDRWFPAVALRTVTHGGYGQESLGRLVDARLENRFDRAQVERVLKVAFWCVQRAPRERPRMREVALMLEGRLHIGDPPYSRVCTVASSDEASKASSVISTSS